MLKKNVSNGVINRKIQYSLGVEQKVAANLWLDIDVGSESGDPKGNSVSALGNLRWEFSPAPTIKF
jgi:hypothetical protein